MNLLTGDIRKIYTKYLATTFGSTLIASIYSIVDMAMVGQYHGPAGSAALAVITPIWTLIFSIGMLMGLGGSVLFSTIRGSGSGQAQTRRSNEYFTVSVIGSLILAAIIWCLIIFFDAPLLRFFGANETTLPIAREYVLPIKFVIPCFLLTEMLTAYLRNDKDPGLATASVLTGGIFNIFGDYFFVFTCDFGAFGAGLATAIGSAITMAIVLLHFFKKTNTLHLVRPTEFGHKFIKIVSTGFPTYIVDSAAGILTILFNRQIMAYLGTDALAVYGVVVNIGSFVQCCAYSVGQSGQPIFSTNFGAGQVGRIRQTLRYCLITSAIFGVFWTAIVLAVPNAFIWIFMSPTESVLRIAPPIIRTYGLSFLLLPFNIFSTYYFQAIMRPAAAFTISITRGLLLSSLLIECLPLLFGADAIWLAMPLTELVISIIAAAMMVKYTKKISQAKA